MKRSRVLYFAEEVNEVKLASLSELHEEYLAYLRSCVTSMVDAKRASVGRADYRSFFPKSVKLSTNIALSIHNHAVEIVKAWFASAYSRLVKRRIKLAFQEGLISEGQRFQAYTVGKYGVSTPSELVDQEAIDLYWNLLLEATRAPEVSSRVGMRLSVHTGTVKVLDLKLSQWWLGVSVLVRGKRVYAPLKANPFIKDPKAIQNGCLVRKDRLGRWRVEVLETKLTEAIPVLPVDTPRVGVDVGLNVLAATSDGRLYGSQVKPKFDGLYAKVKKLKANRQRQGLKENSKRLDVLEARLSGMVKTETGRVANRMINDYPGHVFVIEDLDLRGCKGQKRFAYRAIQSSLEKKAQTIKVNPAYTSQQCPSCGYVSRTNRTGTAFRCRGCGKICHADVVGAKNLLRRSQDNEVTCDDHYMRVQKVLRERYRHRRDSSLASSLALPACSPDLTTGVPSKGSGTGPNAEVTSRATENLQA